jgi:hypothetical protein
MKTVAPLTAEQVRAALDYDPATGVFTWNSVGGASRHVAGKIAGRVRPDGYREICMSYRLYLAHRLAWLYVHGDWPGEIIDHIDGDPRNNSIANLRQATRSENNYNQRKHNDNTSGAKGVHWLKRHRRWVAEIRHNGRKIYLGRFKQIEDAIAARSAAADLYHGAFRRDA